MTTYKNSLAYIIKIAHESGNVSASDLFTACQQNAVETWTSNETGTINYAFRDDSIIHIEVDGTVAASFPA